MKLIQKKRKRPLKRFQIGGPFAAMTWQGRAEDVESAMHGIEDAFKGLTTAGMVHKSLLGNIYPYGYDPNYVFDSFNVDNYNQFIDLDLNTEEGMRSANEIRRRTNNGKKAFDNFGSFRSNKDLQTKFRQRYDLMCLMSGVPQKYNSFKRNTDNTYSFTDEKLNDLYLQRAKAAKKRYGRNEKGYVTVTKDGYTYVPQDNTNILLNQYSIYGGSDDKGDYTVVYDPWDLAFTQYLPGGSLTTPHIRIKGYDNAIKDTNSPESLVLGNSTYSKDGSIYLNSGKKPSEPPEYYTLKNIAIDKVKTYFKDLFK